VTRPWCPICFWRGCDWKPVESRPNVFQKKLCPRCGGYPRDRVTCILLDQLQKERCSERLLVGEVGGSKHSYSWKKDRFRYWNADVPGVKGACVDLWIHSCRIKGSPPRVHVTILSYVLSEIETKSFRIRLLHELHRLTLSNGHLIFFDDLDLRTNRHRIHDKGAFFHRLQFGNSVLGELKEAGWYPTVIKSIGVVSIQAELEVPFILASRDTDRDLSHWASRTNRKCEHKADLEV
jgi:hypothetical protein